MAIPGTSKNWLLYIPFRLKTVDTYWYLSFVNGADILEWDTMEKVRELMLNSRDYRDVGPISLYLY